MTVGIRNIHRQRTASTPQGGLKGVVVRVRYVLQRKNLLDAQEGPARVDGRKPGRVKVLARRQHVDKRWLGLDFYSIDLEHRIIDGAEIVAIVNGEDVRFDD